MDASDLKKISQFEKELISEKPWQLKGEVTARKRPKDALLIEPLIYNKEVKAPIITGQKTAELEDLIKQRIKDSNFDDPVRKHKPSTDSNAIAGEIQVNSEKSKVGLADIYEQQFLSNPKEKEAKENAVKECQLKLNSLLNKLNALGQKF